MPLRGGAATSVTVVVVDDTGSGAVVADVVVTGAVVVVDVQSRALLGGPRADGTAALLGGQHLVVLLKREPEFAPQMALSVR